MANNRECSFVLILIHVITFESKADSAVRVKNFAFGDLLVKADWEVFYETMFVINVTAISNVMSAIVEHLWTARLSVLMIASQEVFQNVCLTLLATNERTSKEGSFIS
jgi:ABC-type uncharacterized transport system fused permease/ATPase subunit